MAGARVSGNQRPAAAGLADRAESAFFSASERLAVGAGERGFNAAVRVTLDLVLRQA